MDLNKQLAIQEPNSPTARREFAIAQNRVGQVLRKQGNIEGALKAFRESINIVDFSGEASDADEAGLFYYLGDLLEQLGEFSEAALYWRREMEIRLAIASRSEDRTEADDELASCHNQIGGALEAMEDFAAARGAFSDYLRLTRGVLERDPESATKRRNVAVGEASLARAELALGNLENALTLQTQAANTLRSLRDAEDLGSQTDWAAALALGAELAQTAGDTPAMVEFQDELAALNLDTINAVGRFRKRFIPLIERHRSVAQRL